MTFKEKIAIAKGLRTSSIKFGKSKEVRRMSFICYKTYIVECILKGKRNFYLKFNGKYMNSFKERVANWINYFIDVVHRFWLVHFRPNNDKTLKNYSLIHYGVQKPIHVKVTNAPHEPTLESYLELNGFYIVDESLEVVKTIYSITRIKV